MTPPDPELIAARAAAARAAAEAFVRAIETAVELDGAEGVMHMLTAVVMMEAALSRVRSMPIRRSVAAPVKRTIEPRGSPTLHPTRAREGVISDSTPPGGELGLGLPELSWGAALRDVGARRGQQHDRFAPVGAGVGAVSGGSVESIGRGVRVQALVDA